MTRRKRHQLRCQCCGLLFPAVNSNAKWCSNACTQHAFRERRKAAALVAQPAVIDDEDELPLAWRLPSGHDARTWNGTAIARRQSDGYVNATAVCQANGKRWFDYERLERSQDYIEALQQHLNWTPEDPSAHISPCLDAPELVVSITTGPNELRGTWIHPRLAIDLARWISPAFAVWMDGWFLESIQQSSHHNQSSLPFNPEDLTEGVKIFATSRRKSVDIWRETLRKELLSMVDSQYATQYKRDIPLLTHSKYIEINPRFSREALSKVMIHDRLITSHEILTKLGQPITRANEMYLSAALRAMGYNKSRIRHNGVSAYCWHPLPQLHAA